MKDCLCINYINVTFCQNELCSDKPVNHAVDCQSNITALYANMIVLVQVGYTV